MIDNRPVKKQKLLDFVPPFVPTGAVAASRSSAVEDDEYIAKLNLVYVESDDLFFPAGATKASLATITIGEKVRRALMKKNISEETLRNAVYTDLKQNHGIQFPASSGGWRREMQLRSRLSWDLRYNETDLAHLLYEFYNREQQQDDDAGDVTAEDGLAAKRKKPGKAKTPQQQAQRQQTTTAAANEGTNTGNNAELLERTLLGLNVTTTSKPDMTVLRGESLFFGEFKNSGKYTTEHAAKQCTLYLFALLYFFRARLGINIEAVFGFWVCGVSCSTGEDNDIYSVGFVRLSAPDRLGAPVLPQVYSFDCPTNDVSGIQRLVQFLRSGNEIEPRVESHETILRPEHRIPALLTLPVALWESPLLVRNGTTSMIFKGKADDLLGLLDGFSPDSISYPGSFLTSAESCFLKASPDTSFYLKLRLKDTALREYPAKVLFQIKKHYADVYNRLYPVDPTGDADFGIFLMNDCGTILHESEEFAQLSFVDFRDKYKCLWRQMVSMSMHYLHGDALSHNMVYDAESQELCLIDLDEGTHGNKAAKRVVRLGDDGDKYPYLRYPNFLRAWKNRERYTKLQLVAAFLQITTGLFAAATDVAKGVSNAQRMLVTQLDAKAAAVNSFLAKKNDADPNTAHAGSSIHNSVDQLIALMRNMLEE